MLRRLYLIFLRYAEQNLSLDRTGGSLQGGGQIDRIALRANRLIIQGWSNAPRVGVVVNRTRAWAVPDVAQPGRDERAFSLDIPFEAGQLELHVAQGDQAVVTTFDGFNAAQVARARAWLVIPYITTLFRLLPVIWRWKRRGDMGAREVVKEELGLVPKSNATEMSGAVLAPFDPAPCPFEAVILVLPVYNAFEVLQEALVRVEAHTDLDWHLIVIEDGSTDAAVAPWLSAWCATRKDRVTLLENPQNLGFIRTVNRGLEAARTRSPNTPVVLLNSDALVPANWVSRLVAPLADPNVATVTPMSNDAEIFTVPVICARHDLRPGEASALDAVAATLHPKNGLAHAPTGVGFCMAMSPGFVAKIPALDTCFGRGYGEETDWCQKARAQGGVHLALPNLFVEHRGGVSFGSIDKQKLLERNGAEISRRYPTYDAEVQAFIRDDPLNTARLALGLAWAVGRQTGDVPVYLAHAMGGGADKYLQDRIANDITAGGSAVVLRVGQGLRWKLELHTPHGVSQGMTNDLALIEALMAYLPRRRIVYSCGVGAYDAAALPGVLLGLAGPDHAVEILFHDFFPISPSYTLLDKDGIYRGVPMADHLDPAHHYSGPNGREVPLAAWQDAWGRLMARAETCVVFSDNSRDLVAQAYPAAAETLVVKPHPLLSEVPRIAAPAMTDVPVIGVLGNIGYQKGAALVQQLSRDLARSGAARVVVIGHVDPAYPLAKGAGQEHGSYELRDLPGLVARYGINGWLMPSIWPETFSFVTHEALATGLPVISFDLGAQGDAVARAVTAGARGGVITLPQDGALDFDMLQAALLGSINAGTF